MRYKSYDDLLEQILTAYKAAANYLEINQGDELYIRAAGLASALWGLYKELDYVERQIFEDTADENNLIRHALTMGIVRTPGESLSSLLARVLNRKRRPSAGGNRYDFERWSLEYQHPSGERAGFSKCYPNLNGIGTVAVVVSNQSDPQPSSEYLAGLKNYLFDLAPVSPAEIYTYAPVTREVTFRIRMSGGNRSVAETLIREHLSSLSPGDAVRMAFVVLFCIQSGASDAVVIEPNANVQPGPSERIVPIFEWV